MSEQERGTEGGSGSALLSPLGLYIHIPFCETRCPYCDFNAYAGMEASFLAYRAAIERETSIWGRLLGRPVAETVFFGGGTPSYLPVQDISEILGAIRTEFEVAPGAETTLEANPGDFSSSKLAAYLETGVNRLSIGIQSLDDRMLGILGRRHSVTEAIGAYQMAVGAGFTNISIDLIYGLPHQDMETWRRTLDGIAELDPPHVSMYCLTVEEGTPLEQDVRSGRLPESDPDSAADMYLAAQEVMLERGYRHYEISNWARPGFESRHNLVYWRNQPYLGIGPGAHSYVSGLRFSTVRSPDAYIDALRDRSDVSPLQHGLTDQTVKSVPSIDTVEAIDRQLEMAETLMMGLRLDTGVSFQEFDRRFAASLTEVHGDVIDELVSLGLLETVDGHLRLTQKGRLLGNEVFSRFFRQ